jgi:formate C-acetyltransferase
VDLLRDFLRVLHRDYAFKSGTLLGDTGQIIVAAGLLENGDDASNELTELFLEAVGSVHQTEPKILLRVGTCTPRPLIERSVECLRQHTGSPLYSNDELVVPLLLQFGFSLLDARDYASAACWEPLVPGKSLDQGNLGSLNFLSVLPPALLEMPDLRDESDFAALVEHCKVQLVRETKVLLEKMDRISWKPAPLMSLFMDDCLARGRDLSQGGAAHNNYGFTTVGLPNLVDSLLNLRRFVLSGAIDFHRIKNALRTDFQGELELSTHLRNQPVRFGSDQPQVLELSNFFTDAVDQVLNGRRNRLGGCFKFGLSSPDYVTSSRSLPATPDGRGDGEPLKVHISGSGIEGACYTDLVRFAGKLDYQGHRFNGNVVDFVVDPALVEAPQSRFTDFLEGAIRCGFFQMQMTIVDSATIRAALDNPEKFPNLIVRVWGFSAYFKDLPQEYRQVVLERTLRSEAARR